MIASGYQIIVKQKADQRRPLADIWTHAYPPGAPKQKTLTEISGRPGIGKSQLLFHIMARVVLPETIGRSSKVIYIDLTHKREVNDFEKCLQSVVALNSQTKLCPDFCAREFLQSIISISCYSSEQFDLALEELEDILWDDENVSLLAINGLDAFYWEDCYGRLQRMTTHYTKLCQRLKKICQEHNICCIYTLDSNYLQNKYNRKVSVPNPLVDYKLKLTLKGDDCFFLNGNRFTFDNSGTALSRCNQINEINVSTDKF